MTNANERLAGFIGTTTWYEHQLFRGYSYTDGVQHLASVYQSYWLIDFVLSWQVYSKVANEQFQVWELKRLTNHSFDIVANDGNGKEIARHHIPFDDFEQDKANLWV